MANGGAGGYCKGFIKVIKEYAAVLVKWDEMDGVGIEGKQKEREKGMEENTALRVGINSSTLIS
jgi:hypothetical protein